MERIARWMVLAVLGCVWCAAAAHATSAVTVRALLQDPDRYDGKVITVVGTIAAYREAVTAAGSPYTAFRLTDEDASVSVFIWNKQGLGDGQRVRVTGAFERVRQYGGGEGVIQAHRIQPVP
jgi:DNA polymerase III alpha subunit